MHQGIAAESVFGSSDPNKPTKTNKFLALVTILLVIAAIVFCGRNEVRKKISNFSFGFGTSAKEDEATYCARHACAPCGPAIRLSRGEVKPFTIKESRCMVYLMLPEDAFSDCPPLDMRAHYVIWADDGANGGEGTTYIAHADPYVRTLPSGGARVMAFAGSKDMQFRCKVD